MQRQETKGKDRRDYFRKYMRQYQRDRRFMELDTDGKIAFSLRHTSKEQFQAVCQDLWDAGYDFEEILGIVLGVWLDKTQTMRKREPEPIGFILRYTSEGIFVDFEKVDEDKGEMVDHELQIFHKGPETAFPSEKYLFEMEEAK